MYVLALTSPFAYLLARSMLLSTHGAIEAGFVAAAYGIGVSIRLVLNPANGLYLTPLVNRNSPKPDRIAAVAEYLRILIVLVVLSTLVIVLFPSQWLLLLYSSEFIDALPLVTVFVLAEAVLLVAGVSLAQRVSGRRGVQGCRCSWCSRLCRRWWSGCGRGSGVVRRR